MTMKYRLTKKEYEAVHRYRTHLLDEGYKTLTWREALHGIIMRGSVVELSDEKDTTP